jgi:L-lactate dehydrogenase complex protein LldG
MNPSASKEQILKKIRSALENKVPNPFPNIDLDSPIYQEHEETNDILFAKEFTNINGQFIYCSDTYDLSNNLRALIDERKWTNIQCYDNELLELFENIQIKGIENKKMLDISEVGVTSCELLIARTGSILVSTKKSSGRSINIFPPVHIVIASTDQLVYDLKEALHIMKKKYKSNFPSMLSVVSGPSRTADIEKTLVLGAHGPKELYVFLIEK